MGKPYSRWPEKALEVLEHVVYELKRMEAETRRVQVAIKERDSDTALLALSDVRCSALTCVEHLKSARTGNYEKEIPAWTPNETTQREKVLAR